MYELQYATHFCAAHKLVNYPGDCANLHGHNWKVVVCVQVKKLNDIGIAIDLKTLKSLTEEVIDQFDHKYLNDFDHFKNENPTSERLAKYIFSLLQDKLQEQAKVASVSIGESDKYLVTYREDV